MKFWRALLGLLLVPVIGWLATGVASAHTLTASGRIHLRGVVAPAHYVIVDGQGKIIKIISNTSEDTVPLIFKNQLDTAHRWPLTDNIYKQYQTIVPAGTSRPGTLYSYQKLTSKPAEELSITAPQMIAPRPQNQVLSLSLTIG